MRYTLHRYTTLTMPDVPRQNASASVLPLSAPVFQILLSLVDRDLHGYAIIRDIRERSAGEIDLTASTLYAAIKRLLDSGLIEELEAAPDPADDDPRRRYYRLTPLGLERARLEAARLERLVRLARSKRLTPRRV